MLVALFVCFVCLFITLCSAKALHRNSYIQYSALKDLCWWLACLPTFYSPDVACASINVHIPSSGSHCPR